MKESALLACDSGGEKSRTFANRAWEVLGFGTHYTWLFCVVFGTVIYSESPSPTISAWSRPLFMAGLAIAYTCMFFIRSTRFATIARNRNAIIVAGGMESLATILLVAAIAYSSIPIIAIAACLAGMSNAFIMIAGNIVWSRIRSERVMIHLTAGALMAGILYFLFSAMHPLAACTIVCALPLMGTIILAGTRNAKQRPPSFRRVDPTSGKAPTRLLIFMICVSFAWGAALGALYAWDFAGQATGGASCMMLGALAASILAFTIAARVTPTHMLKRFSQAGTFALMAGTVLALIVPREYYAFACAFATLGFVLLDLFLWYLNADLVSRSGRSPLDVLARACATEWLAALAGYLAAGYTVQVSEQGIQAATIILFAFCALLLAFAQSFVFTSIEALQLIDVQEPDHHDSLEDACSSLAEEHSLSARESEVMLYLAYGRSVPYIQDKLTLSQSTVKTHVRNIYRKLGVDGKQSLIDLVEDVSEQRASRK
ncbi:MAG: LuxR family transcriptional regulator [Eggerthellaceae bacterium]|nr:LuxR family transcriptional regulator [Eggerthellaceae bacterium]